MENDILVTWQTHCRLNEQFVAAIPPAALGAKIGGKGRSAGAVLAHIHNNRLAWLEPAAPDLMAALRKVNSAQTSDHELLLAALTASGTAVAGLLTRSLEAGKVKGFRGPITSFLGYLIAHDSYHHGEIGLILGQAGYKLAAENAYALWDWRTN
ncbi:MAG: hypothetical protein H6660_05045 [Ardenticatenaceae bacterium]|nr:hypothetical protein [Ardenticatenaceae bacterium]